MTTTTDSGDGVATTKVVPRPAPRARYREGKGMLDSIGAIDRFICNGVVRRVQEGEGLLDELEAFHLVVVAAFEAESYFIGWLLDNDMASTAEIALAVNKTQQAIAKRYAGRSRRRGRDWRAR